MAEAEHSKIEVSGIPVEIVRKDIKNLHISVYPPAGRVRVSTPQRLDNEAVRLAVITRLPWIRRQQAGFVDQERQSKRELVSGESHFVEGHRYLLDVVEAPGRTAVRRRNNRTLEIQLPPGTGTAERDAILQRFYRRQLREQLPGLLEKWQPIVGAEATACGIKRMKTRWGTCNQRSGRIWLNLELAKKPPICVEYVLVHELVHLLERSHNEEFQTHMDRVMPQWRLHRDELNRSPLAHENWDY